uniref:G-protein coupled receptors family 1 profile domain-containing protein n=1 Tax=Romanomermis culicivorax TaxID=13658 RepID=A0A915I8W4_ROMCU
MISTKSEFLSVLLIVTLIQTETAVVVQKKSSVYQNPFLALNGGGGGGSPMLTNLLSSHGSKLREKLLYLKERKAIKTISVVVFGFIICWLPFFVVYIAELVCDFHEPQLATRISNWMIRNER